MQFNEAFTVCIRVCVANHFLLPWLLLKMRGGAPRAHLITLLNSMVCEPRGPLDSTSNSFLTRVCCVYKARVCSPHRLYYAQTHAANPKRKNPFQFPLTLFLSFA